MIDLLLRALASNLAVSACIALAALAVHRSGRAPALAHVLWVVVLVKLVTPPVLTLPLIPVPQASAPPAEAAMIDPLPMAAAPLAYEPADAATVSPPEVTEVGGASASVPWSAVLLGLWCAGSAAVAAGSLVRVRRFDRLLGRTSREADAGTRAMVRDLARRLGLRRPPAVRIVDARLSPLVWWAGGRVTLVVPAGLRSELSEAELRWVLAHELAHIRRRDHVVRWLEWLACVLCWWNPIAWLARRGLRTNEEICCDALVLRCLRPGGKPYAGALVRVAEFLAAPAHRPPASAPPMACAMHTGGPLERRFRMIMKDRTKATPRWMLAGALAAGVALLPVGVAYAQDFDAVGQRLRAAVREGELSSEQARAMMEALRGASGGERTLADARRAYDERALADARRAYDETKRAVAADELSRQDASRRLSTLRGRLSRDAEREVRALERDYAEAERRVKRAVDEEQLSPREGERKLIERRREIDAERRAQSARQRSVREQYERAAEEIERAADAGAISEVEAEREIVDLRRRLGDLEKREREMAEIRERYLEIERGFGEAVERGRISEFEADRALADLRGHLFGLSDTQPEEPRRERRRAIERKIEDAVVAGELSRREAEKKRLESRTERVVLLHLRHAAAANAARRMRELLEARGIRAHVKADESSNSVVVVGDERALEAARRLHDEVDAEPDRARLSRERYDAALAELHAAVGAGKVSIEEAYKKVLELREKMADRPGYTDRSDRSDRRELRRGR
ncbi:MAG: M56 family metallopeptidase [Planctomycetota bacterium]